MLAQHDRISPQVMNELKKSAQRIRAGVCALRLWERVLTEADRQRLGNDLEAIWRRRGTAGIWMELHGVSAERAIVDVAYRLNMLDDGTRRWLLRELGESADDPLEALEAAIESGALVLVANPREAHWRGEKIEVDWEKRSVLQEFFWALCRNAKSGHPVDRATFGSSPDRGYVTKQKSRLLAEPGFPVDLGDLIEVVGRGTQKLTLSPEQIRIFEIGLGEPLQEWAA